MDQAGKNMYFNIIGMSAKDNLRIILYNLQPIPNLHLNQCSRLVLALSVITCHKALLADLRAWLGQHRGPRQLSQVGSWSCAGWRRQDCVQWHREWEGGGREVWKNAFLGGKGGMGEGSDLERWNQQQQHMLYPNTPTLTRGDLQPFHILC